MSELIRHSLGLAINLIDTTTGKHIGDARTVFTFDRSDISHPINKGAGTFIILNYCRENFHMQIENPGYATYEVDVDYELLDKNLPLLSAYLIPEDGKGMFDSVIALRGNIPLLSEMTLVRFTDVMAHTDGYDPKKRILTVFEKGNRLNMEGSPFGIISPGAEAFETIQIMDQRSDSKVILKSSLQGEFSRNAPIARIIIGTVKSNGDYHIAIRNNGGDKRGILRLVVDGEERFMKVDFSSPEEIDLSFHPTANADELLGELL